MQKGEEKAFHIADELVNHQEYTRDVSSRGRGPGGYRGRGG